METSIFKYTDTNSSRANIEYLNRKFAEQRVAIIGMGGTGSYILDLVSKTPVKEIHIYDGDNFELHNAFRAPGAIDGIRLDDPNPLKKVDYYFEIYSLMHGGIIRHCSYVTSENLSDFAEFDFVFVSVDNNKTRSMIISGLLDLGVSVIDTGLGVNNLGDKLVGTVRVTVSTSAKNDHLSVRIGSHELDQNEYATNIQIADLNCINAALAVIKWKKLCGFYQDLKEEHNLLYFINTNKLMNEDFTA